MAMRKSNVCGKPGDNIELSLKQEARLIVGNHLNQGKVAIEFGPLVLAADEALLKADRQTLTSFAIAKPDVSALALRPEPAPLGVKTWPGMQLFRINAVSWKDGSPVTIHLISFADAGGTGSRYKVWLPLPKPPSAYLPVNGVEGLSRPGNQTGSIIDENPQTLSATHTGQPAKEDWFVVTLEDPTAIRRQSFHPTTRGTGESSGFARPRHAIVRRPAKPKLLFLRRTPSLCPMNFRRPDNSQRPKPPVLVIGSSNTDLIIKVARIPKPGETILGGEFARAAGGKGANQAVAAARAGGEVTFIAA